MTVKKYDFFNAPELVNFSQLSALFGKHPNIVSRDIIFDAQFPRARVIGWKAIMVVFGSSKSRRKLLFVGGGKMKTKQAQFKNLL